ncbi:MAG: hypothetical protein ACYC3S_04950 [Chloroflexota bacterium]
MAEQILGTAPVIGGMLILLLLFAIGLVLARIDLSDTPPKG